MASDGSPTIAPPSRTRALGQATKVLHEALDHRIMTARPFDSREGYGRFVLTQYLFQRDLAPLYNDADLGGIFSGLAARSRLARAAADLGDLGLALPAHPEAVEPADRVTALGWLYVSEGSTLGAAFLLKAVEKLGFGPERGARHLAPDAEGRGPHWKRFVAQLDAVNLDAADEARVQAGANAAFARFRQLFERVAG